MSEDPLARPVAGLRGAGPVTAARLGARGHQTIGDLLSFLPRGYDDLRQVRSPSELAEVPAGTTVVVRGTVKRVHLFPRRILDLFLEGAPLKARWFRPPPGMAKLFVKGAAVALAGALRRLDDGSAELVHPMVVTAERERLDSAHGLGLRPRYGAVEGVPGRTVEKIVAAALEQVADDMPDPIPPTVRARLGFPSLGAALRQVHAPPATLDGEALAALQQGRGAAHGRLAFDELLVLQLALAVGRQGAATAHAPSCPADRRLGDDLRAALPFQLTRAQERAIDVVLADLARPHPMQRLLHGEVGSGKTAVAFAAALAATRAGRQTMLMVPTEVLADQHARTLVAWGDRAGVRVGLLTGSLAAGARRETLAAVAGGAVDLLIGTHALLEEQVRVPALALTIVDEQHRFGVTQRARLRLRGGAQGWSPRAENGMLPHLLVLTATPIPRTLALTAYGDLDLTLLDELPPGRRPVATALALGAEGRAAAYAAVAAAVARGEQAFVVCPVIGEDGQTRGGRSSAVARFRELGRVLRPARVALVHGQLPTAEQQDVVSRFRAGALDVLVSTTVLEVGVDVPRATVMVIEDAERFGLAQLHQLRGRVGRGTAPASCWLCTSSRDEETLARLQFVEATTDGLRIAEEDLRRRGPGELFGSRQSGALAMDLGRYTSLLEQARGEARAIVAADPGLAAPEHALLRGAVARRLAAGIVLAEEVG